MKKKSAAGVTDTKPAVKKRVVKRRERRATKPGTMPIQQQMNHLYDRVNTLVEEVNKRLEDASKKSPAHAFFGKSGLPQRKWRIRRMYSSGGFMHVTADCIEDAIRQFNGANREGSAMPRSELEIMEDGFLYPIDIESDAVKALVERLAAVETEVGELNSKLARVKALPQSLERTMNSICEEVGQIKAVCNTHGQLITAVETQVTALNAFARDFQARAFFPASEKHQLIDGLKQLLSELEKP